MNHQRAIWLALTAVLLWSTVATAFKLTLAQLTPVQMVFAASATSGLFLLLLAAQRRHLPLLWPTFRQAPKTYLLLGLLNPLGYYLILFQAYDLLPAQQAQAINYSWAITLTIMSAIFLHHPFRKHDVVAAVLCYAGVVVIATQGQLLSLSVTSPFGVVLALISTLLWAGYWIINRTQSAEPIITLLLGFLVALPLSLLLMLLEGASWQAVTWQGYSSAIYIGLFEMGATFVLWLSALKQTDNTARLSNLIFLSPFLSLIILNQVIDEPVAISTIIGLCLIILGLVFQQWRNRVMATMTS
ncbi:MULTISPECIES: DMT family transporter [unclassified Vibrio]|uniref:DMT family transporter n=1 Tax=Vibrio sp. HB236076 TaxID=3232307 RepID=A0AB39HFL6_9VIBR|nr:DMT family transporter [Vibrio sp. HB161653]MDP5255185.1 DMT family transporter [Vibrio sp. HB161653]